MASSFGMINFNSTILAFVPIVSHILWQKFLWEEFPHGRKLAKVMGFISAKAAFVKISQNEFL